MTSTHWLETRMHEGAVCEVVLNRAPVNALTPGFLFEFRDLISELEADDTIRAIVLTSPFKVLSAGLDLKEAQSFDTAQQAAIVDGLNQGFLALFACAKPTIVAISGAAIAGGLFFVLASDYRVAMAKARLGLAEVRVGVDFPIGPMEIARATLSANDMRRLMLTGQPMDAVSAQAAGIVDVIATDEDLRETAFAAARDMGQLPPRAFAAIKAQTRGAVIDRLQEAIMQAEGQVRDWYTSETSAAMRRMIG